MKVKFPSRVPSGLVSVGVPVSVKVEAGTVVAGEVN